MERRQFIRLDIALDVEYRVLESLKDLQATRTEDISEGGIRVMLPEKIKPNTYLEITINIPNEPPPVLVVGKVIWLKSDALGGVHMTGIELVHITQEDRERLYKYAIF